MSESRISESSLSGEPPRLLEGRDGIATLLRAEQNRHPGASPTFSQLRAASARQKMRRFAALSLAAFVPVLLIFSWAQSEPASITAEELWASTAQDSTRSVPGPSPSEERPAAPDSDQPEEIGEPDGSRGAVLPTPSIAPTVLPDKALERPATREVSLEEEAPAVRAVDCSLLSRAGKFEAALGCLKEASKETGTSAELSLLESARLRFHVTGDPEGALSDLRSYNGRFPQGALRREAGLLELEVLMALGQSEQARDAIDRLLPLVPEQQTTLLQRALELDLALGNCAGAKEHAQALETLGALVPGSRERLEACQAD